MDFRIADTFTDSLAKLTDEQQKSAKITAFDLQLNSANPGMSFHKLDKAKDKINEDAWATLNSETSPPFDKPKSGRIAVKVINHLGDEVMKVFKV